MYPLKLECFALRPDPPRLVPARAQRDWMSNFPGRHPYRCLPLAIANAHGWEVLSPVGFTASWTGAPEREAIVFEPDEPFPMFDHFAVSHFTRGIVTFHTGYMFRTPPGWNLFVSGPANEPKDGIQPLTGIVEAEWLPYPFTMNWQFTRTGVVRFEKDQPFCCVFPVPTGAVSDFVPEIRDLDADPELNERYQTWRRHRDDYLTRRSEGAAEEWQKFYFSGVGPAGADDRAPDHVTKLRPQTPVDYRRKP